MSPLTYFKLIIDFHQDVVNVCGRRRTVKMRAARFRDKQGLDFDSPELASRKEWSTQGRWYYVAWVEAAVWAGSTRGYGRRGEKEWKLSPGRADEDIRFDPEIHESEVWKRPIVVDPFFNRLAYAVGWFFIEDMKHMLAQAYAMGAGDARKEWFENAYLKERRDIPGAPRYVRILRPYPWKKEEVEIISLFR